MLSSISLSLFLFLSEHLPRPYSFLFLFENLSFYLQLHNFFVGDFQFVRHAVNCKRKAEAASSIRSTALSGKNPVGDIPAGQIDGRLDGVIGYFYPVIKFILVVKPSQDGDQCRQREGSST